jgi:VIT1/CCC1 family predicted Fe2+/Mn2+ transporter
VLSESDITNLAKTGLEKELKAEIIYIQLAQKLPNKEIAYKLANFAKQEKEHAAFWQSFLENRKIYPQIIKINKSSVSTLLFIYGLLGIGLTLKLLESGEQRVIELFLKAYNSDLLSHIEKEQVKSFLLQELIHEEELMDYSTKFKIFINKIGIIFAHTSEGLVIVVSTAIGLSGVYTNPVIIGIAGLIVGLAATLSTVVASYFFYRTETRIKQDIIKRIKLNCECAPEAYQHRIEKYMKNKSYNEQTAKTIATEAKEKNMIERIIAEEEYGIKEKTLESPLRTALLSGAFKTFGTVFPLIPFLAGYPIQISIPASIIITIILLSAIGSIAAIAAQVDIKKKVIELTTGGLILSVLTFLLANLTSFLIQGIHLV